MISVQCEEIPLNSDYHYTRTCRLHMVCTLFYWWFHSAASKAFEELPRWLDPNLTKIRIVYVDLFWRIARSRCDTNWKESLLVRQTHNAR